MSEKTFLAQTYITAHSILGEMNLRAQSQIRISEKRCTVSAGDKF